MNNKRRSRTPRAMLSAGWALALVLTGGRPANGWWNDGHEHIAEGAVGHLPPTLEAFFRFHLTYLKAQAGVEPPGTHYIDIDAYPEFNPADPNSLPRDLATLIALHGQSFVNQQGTGPWTTATYVTTLSTQMANATTAADWTALLLPAAELAHYVGDLHNPLHLTLNYNGQLTGNTGIHGRYEGEMVWRNLTDLAIVPNPAACVHLASPIDSIFDGIYARYPFITPIMQSDSARRGSPPSYGETYYAGLWADTGPFTHVLFQQATEALASAWYTAWVDAGAPDPVYPPGRGDHDLDGDVDLVDWAGAQRCAGGAWAPACPRVDFDASGAMETGDVMAFTNALHGPLGARIAAVRQAGDGSQVTVGAAIISSSADLVPDSSASDLYVQDESGGLRIYAHRYVIEAILHQASVGDRVRITGTLGQRNGMRELTSPLNLLSHIADVPPEPIAATASDFIAGSSTAESLEGSVVRLGCATFPAGGALCSNCTYTVSTAAGTVRVWISSSTTGLIGQPRPAGPVDLLGIFGQFDATAPFDSGYQLWLRRPTDIIAPAECP